MQLPVAKIENVPAAHRFRCDVKGCTAEALVKPTVRLFHERRGLDGG